MDLYEIPVFTTDGAIGLPFCRLPISKDLVFSAGASITHEEEFPTNMSAWLTKFIYTSLPAEVINDDLLGYFFKNQCICLNDKWGW